jgi:acyl carrier protein
MGVIGTVGNLQIELASLIGRGLGVDIERLERDELFSEVIENFDSLAMLEIILLLEEKEGFELDQHLGNGGAMADPASANKDFPVNISALSRALIKARQAEIVRNGLVICCPNSMPNINIYSPESGLHEDNP